MIVATPSPGDDARPPARTRLRTTVTDLTLSRRGLLRGATAGAVGAGLGVFAGETGAIAVSLDPSLPRYLSAADLKILTAVVDRIVPGQPEDLAVGAVQVGCPQAIDALLAAFQGGTPRIFAGGPFSDRGGSPVNHFAQFLPLDPYEEKAWRLRIQGSAAAGVVGFQETYTRGLQALAKAAPGFALLPGPLRDLVLRGTQDPAVVAMRDLAITHALEFYFAAPEYGGNRGTGGWQAVGFEGDRQPRGYTREEVENPTYAPLPIFNPPLDSWLTSLVGSLLGALTATVSGLLSVATGGGSLPTATRTSAPALSLSTSEAAYGLSAGGGDHAAVREALGDLLAPLADPDSAASHQMAALHDRAAELVAEATSRGGAR